MMLIHVLKMVPFDGLLSTHTSFLPLLQSIPNTKICLLLCDVLQTFLSIMLFFFFRVSYMQNFQRCLPLLPLTYGTFSV